MRHGETEPDVIPLLRRIEAQEKEIGALRKENERLHSMLSGEQRVDAPVRVPRIRSKERRAAALAAAELRRNE